MAEVSANLEWLEKMLGEKTARSFLWVILLGVVAYGGLAIVEKAQAVFGNTEVPWAEYLAVGVVLGLTVGIFGVGIMGFVWAGRFIGLLRFRDREMMQMQSDINAIKEHLGIP